MLNAPVPGIDREQQLRQLMADHGSSVLQVSYLYLKDYPLAQDAAQTVFLKVWEALANPSGNSLLMSVVLPFPEEHRTITLAVHADAKDRITGAEFTSFFQQTSYRPGAYPSPTPGPQAAVAPTATPAPQATHTVIPPPRISPLCPSAT